MYLNEGFADYLSKPIESAKLEELLTKYLPPSLVLHRGDAGFEENGSWNGRERRLHSCGAAGELFTDVFDLNIEQALKNCGGKDVFKEAVKNFVEAIEEKSAAIESYAAEGDWKNYTVLVHALKSSARLIGAEALSEEAAKLEELGGREAADEIRALSPALLARYRAYLPRLAVLAGNPAAFAPADKEKSLISEERLREALEAMKEAVSAFDFDMADAIIAELDGYAMGADFAAKYAELRSAVQAVDAARVLALL